MAAFIELIAKIKQKNNGTFKLVDAQDVECDEGKGLDEVLNEKLDKNQGVENTNKVLVTDAEGNVVTQDKEDFEGGGTTDYNGLTNKPSINGIELSGNKTSSDLKMYTQEEVNYLLDDKMDKPYFDVAITDDTTIENTLAGNFKIDSIEGNIYQAEESDIVPTPERPIQIRSKKIKVGEEYVELRSLKETTNLFDLEYGKLLFGAEKTTTTGEAVNDGTSVAIENIYDASNLKVARIYLKSGVKYICKYERNSEIIEGTEQGNAANLLGIMKEDKAVTQIGNNNSYTPNESGYYEFYFYGGNGYKVTYSNIMLVEGTSAPSSYVAPTVRDYKIVDHKTKTSKIVRNVGYKLLTRSDSFYKSPYGGMETTIKDTKKQSAEANTKSYCNLFNASNKAGLSENLHFRLSDVYLLFNYEGYNDNDKWNEFLDSNELYLVYELATSTEESIPYVETDTNEIGLSWQESTSPSPDIPSEIYEVDEINIKLVGKNLLNKDNINIDSVYVKYDKSTFPCVTKKFNVDEYGVVTLSTPTQNSIWCQMKVELKQNTKYILSLTNVDGLSSGQMSKFVLRGVTLYDYNDEIVGGSWDRGLNTFTTNEQTAYAILALTFWRTSANTTIKFKIQVEEGSVATPYEPYQETSIQHTLSKPLRATKDGSIKDIIDIVNSEVTYNITDFTVDGNTTIALGTDKEKTRVIQINNHPFLNPTNNLKMCCDKLVNDSGKDEELFTVSTALFIAINKNRVAENDISEFKKWFGENPLYFIGISKNPTTEPLEDELVKKLKTLKTFSPVTHVFVEGIAKPKLNAKYPKDIAAAQAQLEQKVITLQEAVIKNV